MNVRTDTNGILAHQIRDQIRGLIASAQLAGNDRLPSVRQLAKDLGVAPGTVAKAYRALEVEGILVTRTGGGTRVSTTATATRRPVLNAVHKLVDTSTRAGVDLDSTIQILRAVWPINTSDTAQANAEHAAKTGLDATPRPRAEEAAGAGAPTTSDLPNKSSDER